MAQKPADDDDDMDKDEVVQTRVSRAIKEELDNRAGNDSTVANEVRKILAGVITTDDEPTSVVRDTFLYDLYTIGTSVSGDETGQDSITTILDQDWDELTDPDLREQVRPAVLNTEGTVYLAGQNSCYAVAAWLTDRLHEQGIDACVHAAEDVPLPALDEDDTLLLLSRTRATAITTLADRATATTDATVIGMAYKPFDIDRELDAYIPFPKPVERTTSYATRNAILQMTALHALFLTDDPSLDTYRETFETVDQFIRDQLTDSDPEEHVARIELEDQEVSLSLDSPFARAAAALDREGDITDDPVVASLGPHHSLGWIGVQAHTEFLHTNSTHCSLGSVRDAVLNVLYRGNAYLLTTLPENDMEPDVYERCLYYLFQYQNSIDNLLKLNARPQDLEGLAFSFNADADDQRVERTLQARSIYGEDSVIWLPDADDQFTRDVLVAVAHYLLVYAILDRRWAQDRQLREEIIRGPEL